MKFCFAFTFILIEPGRRIKGLTDLIVLSQEFLQISRRSFLGWTGWGLKTTTSTWSTLGIWKKFEHNFTVLPWDKFISSNLKRKRNLVNVTGDKRQTNQNLCRLCVSNISVVRSYGDRIIFLTVLIPKEKNKRQRPILVYL